MKHTRLIPIIIVAIMLFNCFMPFTSVFANNVASKAIQLNGELYDAIKADLTNENRNIKIKASFNDKQRKITISDEELAKVTTLDLSESRISNIEGLEKFTSLVELDLSSNELTKDSDLSILSSLKLTKLDLSTNMIEDVSSISNLNSISELNLHSQNFSRTYIISKENVDENGEMAIGQLPEILSIAGDLRPEWVNVKNDYEGNDSGLILDFTKLYNEKTISLRVPGVFNEDGEFNPKTGLLKLEIDVTDTTNIISESKMNIFYLVLGNDQRAAVFKDANLYNVIKKQLTHGENDFNDDLRTYVDGENGDTLYERAYDEPMILVFDIDELMNEIPTLKVSNSKVKDLSGIEMFVGLRNELDVSYNYIDSIEKIVELQKNKEKEELKLQERFKEQIAKLNKVRSEFMEYYNKVEEIDKQIQNALDSVENLKNYIKELKDKLKNNNNLDDNEIKSIQGEITQKEKELGIATDDEGNIIVGLTQKVARELNGYVNEKGENVLGLYAKRDEAAKRAKQALPSVYPEFEKLNEVYVDDYKALTLLPADIDSLITDKEILIAMNEKIKKYETDKNLSEIETVLITGYLADYGIEIEYTDVDGNKIENPISSTISKIIEKDGKISEAKLAILEVDSIIQCINYLVLNYKDYDLTDAEYEEVLNEKIEKIIEEKENGTSSFGYLSIKFDSYSVPTSELIELEKNLNKVKEELKKLEESAETVPDIVPEPNEELGEKPTIEENTKLPEAEPTREDYTTDEEFNAAMNLWNKKLELDKWEKLEQEWIKYNKYVADLAEYENNEAIRQKNITKYEKQINEISIEIVKEIRLNNKKYYIIETFKSLKEDLKKLENSSEIDNISTDAISYLVSASGKFVSLTEEEIKAYVQLPKLKVVNITNNIIETLEGIEELENLKELYAGENEISDLSNVKWENMKKLEILDLHFNMISDIQPLEVITSLEKLNVSNNLLSGKFKFNIIGLPKIYSLDFSNNQYTDIDNIIKQFEWIAKTYEETLEDYLINSEFDIKFHNQRISIPVGTFTVKEGEDVIQYVKLPEIIKQLEELDSRKTVFGTESIYGKVRNDGTVGLMISNEEGKHSGKVTVLTKDSEYGYSIGDGTTVILNYEVLNSKVDDVKVNSGSENFIGEVELGKTMQFNAGVDGTNVEDTTVTWSIQKFDENGTEITLETKTNINSETGLLTVDPEETAKVIKVTATSNYDSTKTATVEVKVIKLKTSVVITPSATEEGLEQGTTKTYSATVETEAEDKEVTWSIEGATSENTKIENGVLTIGEDEGVGTKIIVKATSNYDNTKFATVEETVIEKVKTVEIKINETATTEGLEQGSTKTYTVTIETEAENKEVTWSIEGATSKNTKIENGVLTIGEDEKAGTKITVKVTSNYDNTKFATVEETVIENKVELNKPSNETTVFEQTPGATVNTFVNGLVASGNTVKVLDKEGKEVSNTTKLATGMKVIVNDKDSYTIVVTGDVNGDGKVSDLDSNLIKAFRIGAESLSDVERQAADVNADGKVNRIDSFIMLLYRAGSKEVRDFTPETIENIMK